MRKANYLQNMMVLFGTSLFVLTAFVSCSKNEELPIKQESIETKGQTGSNGCKGPVSGGVYVKQREWTFINPVIVRNPNAGVNTTQTSFYISFPYVSPAINAINLKILLDNSFLNEYTNVPISSGATPYCIPGRALVVAWYDQSCRVAKVTMYEGLTTQPIGVYVEFKSI